MDVFVYNIDYFLYRSGAMCISAKLNWIKSNLLYYLYELFSGAFFCQFLDEVITKAVNHQVPKVRGGCIENVIK